MPAQLLENKAAQASKGQPPLSAASRPASDMLLPAPGRAYPLLRALSFTAFFGK